MMEKIPDNNEYSRLIAFNFKFIERQCRRAAARCMSSHDESGASVNLDNEADAMLVEVLDRLKADDYRALRCFQGKAKLTTYLTTIIANLVVDIVRSRRGRSRAKERACEMGETAERLYDMVYIRGLSVADAQAALEIDFGIHEPLELLHDLLGRIRGREHDQIPITDGLAWLSPGQRIVDDNGEVEVEVVDPMGTPEKQLVTRQRQSLARQATDDLLKSLTGEEQLMLQLRYPASEEESPRSIKEIGELIGVTEKAVDARIRRILIRCRENMLQRGLALDDFVDL